MPRRRERFERSDVPRGGAHRTVVGLVVCVAVLAVAAAVVALLWNRVTLESRLGDKDLDSALAGQAAGPVTEGTGYVATTDDVTTVALFTADGLDPVGPALSSARILAVNATRGTVSVVTTPLEAKVDDEASATLAEAYAAQGYAACVTRLSAAAGVSFDHAIVATEDVLAEAAAIAGSDPAGLVRQASGLLEKIRTDMDATELLALAEALSAAGPNLTASEAVLVPEAVTDELGNPVETGAQVLDATQVAVALGLLVSAA